MPSKSEAQRRLMAGIATGNIKSDKVPLDVATEYFHADKEKARAEKGKKKHASLNGLVFRRIIQHQSIMG